MSRRITPPVLMAAQSGDSASFRIIYEELSPAVLGYLAAKGVSDPEGVTSDVFLSLFPRLTTVVGGPSGLRTLAFSIAHARMVDDHRRRGREPTLVEYDPTADQRSTTSAEQQAVTALQANEVIALMHALPESQRDVLLLRLVSELTVEQVADVIGKSPAAVKQLQRRGLIALRHELAERGVTL